MADIRDVTMAGNKTLADQVAAATGQLPGIVSGLRDQSATRQSNRAQAGQTLRTALEGRNISLAQFKEGERVAGLTAGAKVTAATTSADAKVTAAQVKADAAVAAAQARVAAASTAADKVAAAKVLAAAKAAAGKAKAAATKAAATKPGSDPEYPNLNKTQVTHLRAGVAAAFNGVPEQRDVNNKVVTKALPAVDYQTAINHAISAGYSRAGATKMANHFYMPGKRGRPGNAKPTPGNAVADANLNP
jgi:hypothetical protein